MLLLQAAAPPPLALLPSPPSLPSTGSGGRPLLRPRLRLPRKKALGRSVVAAAGEGQAIAAVIFEPFEEITVKMDSLVPIANGHSLARQKYADDCEAAVNTQINVEYNVSYVYHSLFAYFDRDNVALKGIAKFFNESSEEERDHAEKLMKYQNKRGGKVKLLPIITPSTEFDHPEKGDALYAMELALALEKLTNEKLLSLHSVAEKSNDPQTVDFVESEFLKGLCCSFFLFKVEAIKKIAEYVAQLRRVGKGHGVWHFDQMLLHEGDAA